MSTDLFDLKVRLTGQTGYRNVEKMLPLKYLSNFWRTVVELP